MKNEAKKCWLCIKNYKLVDKQNIWLNKCCWNSNNSTVSKKKLVFALNAEIRLTDTMIIICNMCFEVEWIARTNIMIFFIRCCCLLSYDNTFINTHRERAREKKLANHDIISNGKDERRCLLYVLMIAKRMNKKKLLLLWIKSRYGSHWTLRNTWIVYIYFCRLLFITPCLPILFVKCSCDHIYFIIGGTRRCLYVVFLFIISYSIHTLIMSKQNYTPAS